MKVRLHVEPKLLRVTSGKSCSRASDMASPALPGVSSKKLMRHSLCQVSKSRRTFRISYSPLVGFGLMDDPETILARYKKAYPYD